MEKIIDGIRICYEIMGEGRNIVMLHGWGQNKEMMLPLANRLKNKFRITIIDLPGFGLSSEPHLALDIYSYTEIIEQLLKELQIENLLLAKGYKVK